MMFEIGTGKADITAFVKGIGMMGYGMHFNTVEEIETPLSARAFVIKNPSTQKKIVFVNAEICFITIAIKSAVVKKLNEQFPHFNYNESNVILTAQHTHSAPGGYSHYAFYNLSIPGVVPQVFDKIVNGIVEAINKAENSLQAASIYMNSGSFAVEQEVAFNRSLKAYNQNPEVKKLAAHETHLAVDREMLLLRLEGADNKKIGLLNWFGVHTTNIPNVNTKVCFDNKGYASEYFEKDIQAPDFTAIFAQAPCGDVSPNFVWDKKLNRMRGKFVDAFESARFNGNLQYLKAKEIYDTALNNTPLGNEIDYALTYADFSNTTPDLEFTNGQTVTTGSGCHGVAFFRGTAEGPGMNAALGAVATFLSRTVKNYELLKARFSSEEERNTIINKYKIQGNKDILFETGQAKVLGTSNIKNLILPAWADKSIANFKQQYKAGALRKPWTPQILPLQLTIIGNLAIAGFPGEITTVAGWRLRKTLLNILEKRGVTKVIISPYANAFCGYITTYEEYQCQQYEGGHTVFGEWTLAAFQTHFKKLALQMLEKPENRNTNNGVKPVEFSAEELEKRTYKN